MAVKLSTQERQDLHILQIAPKQVVIMNYLGVNSECKYLSSPRPEQVTDNKVTTIRFLTVKE